MTEAAKHKGKPATQPRRRAKMLNQMIGSALLAALLTAGCTGLQTNTYDDDASAAQQMSRAGNHKSASREYLDLAMTTEGEQRQRYLIFAANELYLGNDLAGADRILKEVGTNIADRNLEVWAEVIAQLRLAQNDPAGALTALNKVTGTDSRESAAQILLLRSDAFFQLEKPEQGVATLVKREGVLTRQADIDANRRIIWSGLQTTGHAIGTPPADDPIVAGWLEIGLIAYNNRGSTGILAEQLFSWQQEHPDHPASGKLLDDALANLNTLSDYPARVALLLPLSGKQQTVGEAIRDGYLAAHYALGSRTMRPEINFYDTIPRGVSTAYNQAIADGAEFIVGPLLKEEIEEVAGLASGVTVLALNYAPAGLKTPSGFYQFALSPEDEARAAADRAADEGMFNAVALVPENTWGQRVLEAFREQLEARGGNLLAAQAYAADTPDFSQAIQEILLLNESNARHNRLVANLGRQLEFEPRRRQDVDLIFVGANAAVATLLKPQLRFHYAGELPTMATSAVYQPGSSTSPDLDGIIFPDIPWLLEPNQIVSESQAALTRYWGPGAERLGRFYAMGYDSYYLTAMLNGRGANSNMVVNGMTGVLSMDRDGQLHRKLKWARMERGEPRVLPDTTTELTENAEIALTSQ